MSSFESSPSLLIILFAFVIAFVALYSTAFLASRRRGLPEGQSDAHPEGGDGTIEILFHKGEVRDLTPAAAELLDRVEYDTSDWQRVCDCLSPRFADLPTRVPTEGTVDIGTGDPSDGAMVRIEAKGDSARLALIEAAPATAADRHLRRMSEHRLAQFEQAIMRAPVPVWARDGSDRVLWSNPAYRRVTEDDRGRTEALATGLPLPRDEVPSSSRVSIGGRNPSATWFDVTVQRCGDTWFHYGIDVSAVIHAEVAQRNFVQTLTKTFALLSIGLAIFDRERRLTLFNPALLDLTGLAPEFLSSRPALVSFFDALRERRVMPEPKNYAGWREAISDLDARAVDGSFEDTWTLPSGLTFRVSGRPYPDGAIAFVIEDISSEVGMARRFNEFTKRAQSALDSFEEAVAIFSPAARMTMCNEAYHTLWDIPADRRLGDQSVQDASQTWQSRTHPSPIWGEVRDFVATFGGRAEWDAEAVMQDGRGLACRFTPLADGSTLAGFRVLPTE